MITEYDTEIRQLGPNTTIRAEIRRLNGLNLDEAILSELCEIFREINNVATQPKVGAIVEIPIYTTNINNISGDNK